MIAELRLVKGNGELGEILPDYHDLQFLDSATEAGQLTFEYPVNGTRADEITTGIELAVLIDGSEPPQSRFRIEDTDGNKIVDGGSTVKWSAPGLKIRFDEALVVAIDKDGGGGGDKDTPDDQAKTRVKTPEEDQRDKGDDEGSSGAAKEVDNKGDKGKKPNPDEPKGPKAPEFKDDTPGQVVRYLFHKAKDRGALREIELGFTPDRDSNGQRWVTRISEQWDIGTSILEVLDWMTENEGVEFRMNGRRLDGFEPSVVPKGPDVTLARGYNLVDGPTQGTIRDRVTALYCVSSEGPHGWVVDKQALRDAGRIEGKYDSGVKTQERLLNLGEKHIKNLSRPQWQYTYGVVPGKGADPYVDYQIGDWVWVLDGDTAEHRRIREIGIGFDADQPGKIALVVNDVIQEREIVNARTLARLRGRNGSKTTNTKGQNKGGGGGSSGKRNGLNQTEDSDGVPPRKPKGAKVTTRVGAARITYDGKDFEDLNAALDQLGVEVHISAESPDFEPTDDTLSDTIQVMGGITVTTADLGFVYGVTDEMMVDPYSIVSWVRLIAVDSGGDRSEPSDASTLQIIKAIADDVIVTDEVPPGISPYPMLLDGLGSIIVHWAQIDNADPVSYRVYASDSPGTAELPENYVGTVQGSSLWVRRLADGTPILAGNTYYVVIVAEDPDGSADPSPEVSITITSSIDELLGIDEVNIGDVIISSPVLQAGITQTAILNAGLITADEAWIEAINAAVTTSNIFQTSNSADVGIKIGDPYGGFVAYGGGVPTTTIDQDTGVVSALGSFRTGDSGARIVVDQDSVDIHAGLDYPGKLRSLGFGSHTLMLSSPNNASDNSAYFTLQSGTSGSHPYSYYNADLDVGYNLHVLGTGMFDDQITLWDLRIGGGSVDAGSRYCRVGDGGRLFASVNPPSARALKEHITEVGVDDVAALLELGSFTYHYKDSATGLRLGTMADDADALGLGSIGLVSYEDGDDTGRPTGFSYDGLAAALLVFVRDLYGRVKALEAS